MSSSLDTKALTKAAGIGAGVGAVMALGMLIPCVNIVCCLLLLALGPVAGVGYGYFAKQNNSPVDAGMGALGGGIAGLVSGLGYSIISGILTALGSLLGLGLTASAVDYGEYGIPPELAAQLGSTGGGIISILMSTCIVLVLTGVLGAIGGLVYSLIVANQTTTSAPPPPAV